MLACYLDESGIHGGKNAGKVCVIAGYFGEVRAWRRFEKDWRKALCDHLVRLEQFHAKDIIKRRGYFSKFSHESQHALIRSLLGAITGSDIFPVMSSVITADFDGFSYDEKRFLTGALVENGRFKSSGCPGKPYFVPFHECIARVASYTPIGKKMHLFFGLDRTFCEYATYAFRQLKLKTPVSYIERLGDAAYPLAKKTPQLQAADFLAYATHEYVEEKLRESGATAPYYLRAAVSKRKSKRDFRIIGAKTMRLLLNGLKLYEN
jgi:hypothetical protein